LRTFRATLRGLLVLLLCAAAVGAGQARAVAQAAKPTLHVVRLKPLTVSGTGFKAKEKIVLRVTGDATGTARGTANARGAFRLTLPAALTTCSTYALRANGAGGSRAQLRAPLKAACKPVATVDFGQTVVVTGKQFRPRERLTVTLLGDGTHTKAVTASAKGLMEVDFGALALSNCSGYTLRIKGSKGSTFKMTHPTQPC